MKKPAIAIIVLAASVLAFSACGGAGTPGDRSADEWEHIEYLDIEFDMMPSWGGVPSESSLVYSLDSDTGRISVYQAPNVSLGFDRPIDLDEYVQDYLSAFIPRLEDEQFVQSFYSWIFPPSESEGLAYEQISAKEIILNELPCYELEYILKRNESLSINVKELFVKKYTTDVFFWIYDFTFTQVKADIYDRIKNSIQ